jgi:hypothetical protein
MPLLIAYLLWVLYSIYEGEREALYFSFKMKASLTQQQSYKHNEHVMFSIQRLFVVVLTCIACYVNWIECSLVVVSLAACFPFLHDGMYYETRKKLDGIYPKGWFDQSTSSTALSDKLHLFDAIPRSILFCLSIGIMCYEIIKFWK